jgi:hypothetical protein
MNSGTAKEIKKRLNYSKTRSYYRDHKGTIHADPVRKQYQKMKKVHDRKNTTQ